MNAGAQLSFSSVFSLRSYGTVPPTFRIGLPTLVKPLWKNPHTNIQSFVSMVISNPSQVDKWRLPTAAMKLECWMHFLGLCYFIQLYQCQEDSRYFSQQPSEFVFILVNDQLFSVLFFFSPEKWKYPREMKGHCKKRAVLKDHVCQYSFGGKFNQVLLSKAWEAVDVIAHTQMNVPWPRSLTQEGQSRLSNLTLPVIKLQTIRSASRPFTLMDEKCQRTANTGFMGRIVYSAAMVLDDKREWVTISFRNLEEMPVKPRIMMQLQHWRRQRAGISGQGAKSGGRGGQAHSYRVLAARGRMTGAWWSGIVKKMIFFFIWKEDYVPVVVNPSWGTE